MKKKSKSISHDKFGYVFIIPFVVIYLVFSLYPTIYTAILGFTDCKGFGKTDWKLLDDLFANYKSILSNPSFITSLKNTLFMWGMNFAPQIVLALILAAWFTSRRNKLKGQGFFKILFYMPNIITAASIALLFSALFGYPTGPVNDILVSFGFAEKPHNFAIDKLSAQIIVAFIQFWMWYGYTMLILISGILGINPEIYESADVDGANGIQSFFLITLPNLKTVLLYTLVTSLVGGLNMYDVPKAYLNGGPDNATLTSNIFIQNQAFAGSYMYNRASAASMLIFIIIGVLSAIIFYLLRDKDAVAEKKINKAAEKAMKQKAKEAARR